MAAADRVHEIIAPLVEAAGLDLYDLELAGGVLRVLVDREGGADIDAISKLTRATSRALDEHDPIAGSYTLEVSTPGLERPLRTPQHYAGAVGTTVKVKTRPGIEGDRRVEGTVTEADAESVTVRSADGTERTLRYDDIERARTTFEWGPTPKNERKARS
ncbi:MAG TPA: ribosome maturation factor RimP [Acidimicrobiales bacterium]